MSEPDLLQRERKEELRKQSRQEATAMVTLAGLPPTRVWELANGYWPDSPRYDDIRKPWWLFLTDIGLIQIGWRKRVLHIEWDTCKVRGIVTADDVTKGDTYVHAWSVEKAVEYLRSLRALALSKSWTVEQCEKRSADVRASTEKLARALEKKK